MNDSRATRPNDLYVGPARFQQGGRIQFGRYESGEIAISVFTEETDDWDSEDVDDQSYYVATVALVPYGAPHPGEHCVWLKGWSENEGVPQALVNAGIVTLTGRTASSGQVEAQHAELTDIARATLAAQIREAEESPSQTVHRAIDELVELKVFTPERARQLKERFTEAFVQEHLRNGLSVSDIIDRHAQV